MKNLLTAAVLLLSVFTVQAQKKCKYNIDKVDQFTGKELKVIDFKIGYSWRIYFKKVNQEFQISLKAEKLGDMNHIVVKGDSLIFALEGEKPLVIYTNKEATPISKVESKDSNPHVVTTYNLDYSCTKEEFETLSNYVVTGIKLFIGNEDDTIYLPKSHKKKIQHSVTCLLN